MTNPTTYFGWQMPTATDLVTDLPADFEVFGQAVDTDFQDLLGGTTGQILSKTSATDLDFTWINNDQGDITAVTAGTGISGGGTSGAVTITNSMATEITAKADLIVGTGNAAFDNLAVGTNGQVLTADSTVSPTGLKWETPSSGGMTLISTTALSGASITLSAIAGTFNNLVIILRDFELAASTGGQLQYQLNSDTTANAHRQITQSGQSTTSTSASATGTSFTTVDDTVGFNPATNYSQITIFDYANAVSRKAVSVINAFGGNTGNIYTQNLTGSFTVTTAITSVKIALSAGTFSAGNALLYGVK